MLYLLFYWRGAGLRGRPGLRHRRRRSRLMRVVQLLYTILVVSVFFIIIIIIINAVIIIIVFFLPVSFLSKGLRSLFKISCLLLRPRPWQFEIRDSTGK